MPIATPQGTLDFKSVDKVTFVGASSNTVIDTTTGSLGVGVGVDGPTSNLHVVGNTRLEGDINMLHTSNTASIKLNSNVVTEFPRSKKLIRYPRVAMTGASAPTGYVASASTALNSTLEAWYVFDTVNPEGSSVSRWRSANSVYTNNSAGSPAIVGTAAQLSASSGTPSGEYILVTLPEKMCLKRYSWSGMTTQGPKDGEIWGSNDGSSWSHVHTFTDGNSGWVSAGSSTSDYGNYPDHRDVGEGNVAFYSRYAFIITKLVGGDVAASVRELEYFGTSEYDPEAHGTDVTVKSYPNVPNTDWLEVYYDAKGLPTGAVSNPISGLGGTTINGTATNVTVSDGAFVFNGSSSYITGGTTSISGNHHHSFSCWLKPTAANSGYRGIGYLFYSGSPNTTTGLFLNNNRPVFLTWGNNLISDHTLVQNEWVHVTTVYDGTGRTIYINSKQIDSDTYSSYSINASATLLVGASSTTPGEVFNGSIANFRIFNRALSSDEIYQLYAYQKEDFGHGDLSMTLKAGRLGIGTSEPRAALDVRGDIHGGCPVVVDAVAQSATAANNLINWNLIAMNKGNGLAGTTFTAPYAGHYFCHMHGMGEWIYTNAEIRLIVVWYKNGSFYGTVGGNENDAKMYNAFDSQYNHTNHMTIGGSIIPYLEVGETIQTFVPNSSNADFHGRYNRLTIHYIG